MSAHGHAGLTHEHSVGSTKLFSIVWVVAAADSFGSFSGLRKAGSPPDDHDSGRPVTDQGCVDHVLLHALAFRAPGTISTPRASHGILHLHDADHVFPGQYPADGPAAPLGWLHGCGIYFVLLMCA